MSWAKVKTRLHVQCSEERCPKLAKTVLGPPYGMKMQQSQPHGLREPLAKKQYCIVALHLSFPTLVGSWKLCCGTKRCNQLLQFAGFAQGMTGPAIRSTQNNTHFRYSRDIKTPETSKLQTLQTAGCS